MSVSRWSNVIPRNDPRRKVPGNEIRYLIPAGFAGRFSVYEVTTENGIIFIVRDADTIPDHAVMEGRRPKIVHRANDMKEIWKFLEKFR